MHSHSTVLPNKQRGFTLIELSVVLVIIGLIVGGVLTGRDLIYATRLRKVGTELQQLSLAITGFRTRYNCLPGDCANATTFFGASTNGCSTGSYTTTGGTCDGNGDGFLEAWWMGTNAIATGYVESYYGIQQLGMSGLYSGNFSGGGAVSIVGTTTSLQAGNRIPLSSLSPNLGYYPFTADVSLGVAHNFLNKLVIQFGAYSTAVGGDFLWGAGLNAIDSAALDRKIDDGFAAGGKLQGDNGQGVSAMNSNITCLVSGNYSTSSATGCIGYYVPDVP